MRTGTEPNHIAAQPAGEFGGAVDRFAGEVVATLPATVGPRAAFTGGGLIVPAAAVAFAFFNQVLQVTG